MGSTGMVGTTSKPRPSRILLLCVSIYLVSVCLYFVVRDKQLCVGYLRSKSLLTPFIYEMRKLCLLGNFIYTFRVKYSLPDIRVSSIYWSVSSVLSVHCLRLKLDPRLSSQMTTHRSQTVPLAGETTKNFSTTYYVNFRKHDLHMNRKFREGIDKRSTTN